MCLVGPNQRKERGGIIIANPIKKLYRQARIVDPIQAFIRVTGISKSICIAGILPEILYLIKAPCFRKSPAPLYRLSAELRN